MRYVRPVLLVVFLAAQAAAAGAAGQGPAYQVADLAPNTPADGQGGDVLPANFQPVTGGDVFLDKGGAGVPAIWRTDGTPGGTRPVVGGASVGYGVLIGSNGERAFFMGLSSIGSNALWATDGTPGGSVLLRTSLGLFASQGIAGNALVVDGRLLFQECEFEPPVGCDLWASDGTIEGTLELVELGSIAGQFAGSGGVGYFAAETVDGFLPTLWKTDGTAGGTIQLESFSDNGIAGVASVGGRALAVAEGKLWATNGNDVEVIATFGNQEQISFHGATLEGGALYFRSWPTNGGNVFTVWRSDGTPAGTSRVLSTSVASGLSTPHPWVQQHGSRVYYLLPGPQGREPYALWSSGAGGEGAQQVTCDGCSSIPDPGWILDAGDHLVFPAAAGSAHTLWAIDSSHIPHVVSPFCSGTCRTESPVELEGRAMFAVDDAVLWVTDGSVAGTRSLGGFHSFSALYPSTNLDGVLFAASPERFGETSLWMSRGTPQSTVQLTAVVTGSEPRELRRAGNRVAFVACGNPPGLWGAGPHDAELVIEDHVACFTNRFQPFVSAGDSAFFRLQRFGLFAIWVTDGTAASTREVWVDSEGGLVDEMAAFGDDLVFWNRRVIAGQPTTSLWRSDGTTAGTRKSFDLPADVSFVYDSTTVGEQLYFRAQSAQLQIWRSDGSAGGTRRLTDQPIGEFGLAPDFTRVGAHVFFTGHSGIWRTNGTAAGTALAIPGPDNPFDARDRLTWLHEQGGSLLFMRVENGLATLWRTQGTVASTQQIAALTMPTWPPPPAVHFGGHLYFAADDGLRGVELWRTDGTAAGTVLVRDIGPGPSSSNPRALAVAKGKLYFTADDPFTGGELWVSDGSAGGTHLVQDIAPYAASSSPADLTVVGDLLYFSADDATTGRELWALPLGDPSTTPPAGPYLTSPEVPGFRFKVRIAAQGGASRMGAAEANCIPETLCVSGAVPGRSEVFLRVVGPKPNGKLWPTLVKFSTSRVEVWVEQVSTQAVRYYDLPGAAPGFDVLPGLFDREGFQPGAGAPPQVEASTGDGASLVSLLARPSSEWFTSSQLPGFRFRVEISTSQGEQSPVRIESDCIDETVCLSGAIPGRSELFLRVVGPRPNGYLWPTLVRFSTSTIDVWLEQLGTGVQQHYRLEGASQGSSDLTGLFDRDGFLP